MGMCQRVNPSMHEYPAVELRTEVNPKPQVRSVPYWPCTMSYIGKSYDVIARPVMSRRRHGMTSLVFYATPYHDVTS